ncbi:MAG: hypothetical protein U0289_14400 [Cyclobacteriaceae bacterium]|nr:hypothetical protein [Cytophagales bacterium]HNP76575.1 hypothetical protein [Cyclobacteriaceae bacterium]HQQ83096.1 hypothetical protein [Cyclobacteriaceae bacterium]
MNLHFPWFRRNGPIYFPKSIPGWAIAITLAIAVIQRFIDIDHASHSASDTLRNWIIQLMILGLLYQAVAWLTSRKD